MGNKIPPSVQNCKSRLDQHLDNSQSPVDSKYPLCFKCNALNPYCVCDALFPKKPSNLKMYLFISLAVYSIAVTYLLSMQ